MCYGESICLLFKGIVRTKFKHHTLVPRLFIDGDSGEIIHNCSETMYNDCNYTLNGQQRNNVWCHPRVQRTQQLNLSQNI